MNIDQLIKSLSLSSIKRELFVQALTHRSYLNEAKEEAQSNERLEFLGDAILSFLVSQHFFTKFPHLPEGELTNLRSATVKTATLARIARSLHLGEYLRLSRGEEEGGGRQNTSLLADTFEAIVGAIYLDQGLEKVESFLREHLFPIIPEIIETKAYMDYKSELQERVQDKFRLAPIYQVLTEEGPDHAKIFAVVVMINGIEEGRGKGRSKQEAEQAAAREVLEKWQRK